MNNALKCDTAFWKEIWKLENKYFQVDVISEDISFTWCPKVGVTSHEKFFLNAFMDCALWSVHIWNSETPFRTTGEEGGGCLPITRPLATQDKMNRIRLHLMVL